MKSMTGYGSSSFSDEEHAIEANIKSVNGRYLDFRFHLPKEYVPFEPQLKKTLKKYFNRGTVDVFISRSRAGVSKKSKLEVKSAQAKLWLKAYRQLADELKLSKELNLMELIELGGLIVEDDRDPVSSKEEKKVLSVVQKAAVLCAEEKDREGQALQKNLLTLLNQLQRIFNQMEKLRERANQELSKRLRQRLSHYDLERPDWEPRWAVEVALLVERSDIHEEMVRLKEHICNFKKLAESGTVQGKKMDFYCQELLRETNTIGSKSQVAKLTHLVVDAKSLIEKLREQVQNVE